MPQDVDLSDLLAGSSGSTKGFPTKAEVTALLDAKLGKGKWRFGRGFATKEEEDKLRAQGAGTVPEGQLSQHSEGTEERPGAWDVTPIGYSVPEAANLLVGSKAGSATIKTDYPEGAHGAEPAHLHLSFSLEDLQPAPKAEAAAAPDAPPTVDLADLVDKPKAPPKKPTPLERVGGEFAHIPAEAWRQHKASVDALGSDVAEVRGLMSGPIIPRSVGEAEQRFKTGLDLSARLPGDVVGAFGGGLASGAAQAALGEPTVNTLKLATGGKDPVAMLTGGRYVLDPAMIGGLETLLFGGEGLVGDAGLASRARAAGVSVEAMRANEAARAAAPRTTAPRPTVEPAGTQSEHQAAVARLRAAGVRPAAHQAAGGGVRRFVEASKADFHVSAGIRDAEEAANDSFNRAAYNKVLRNIGERFPEQGKIGNDGIAYVGDKLSEAYDAVLAKAKVRDDHQLDSDLADIRGKAGVIGKPQEAQFEAILNNDVIHQFGPGGMDGKTFKRVESDLRRQARGFRGSADPNQRRLGEMLDEAGNALRRALDRSSPASIRPRLREIDTAYATFKRVQAAAVRRASSRGEFTPSDLLQAVKTKDPSMDKGSFGRGDALLQRFAQDADLVLSPKVRDSGTAERLAALGGHTVIGDIVGHAVGLPPGVGAGVDIAAAPVTNHLARRMLQRGPPRPPLQRNYLAATQRRAVAAPAAAGLLTDQRDGQ